MYKNTHMTENNTIIPGLTVDPSGTVCLAGKPYYAFGINSFSLVIRYIEGDDKSMYIDQLELAKKYNIPFIRVNFGGFWPDYYKKFDADPDYIISRMHDVVKAAEEYKTGLICSLLWYDSAIPSHVGEHRADMGRQGSKTLSYAKEYTAKIVKEFKDSPAVWAWEIGNEYNLGADLCDPEFRSRLPEGPCTPVSPSGYDFYTSDELYLFYKEIGSVIRSIDPYRMISTGNGDMREASASLRAAARSMDKNTHLWNEAWENDTLNDFYEMCAFFTPDPIDTMCFHLQHAEKNEKGDAYFLTAFNRFGRRIYTPEYFKEYANAARLAHKAMYFGEMGDMMWMENDPHAPSLFKDIVKWIAESGIQLASSWQFASNQLKATDYGIDGEKLRAMRDKNEEYRLSGISDSDSYWESIQRI